MLKIQIIYQWHLTSMEEHLLMPLGRLQHAGKVELSQFNIYQYQQKHISGADVIVFSDVIDRAALLIAEDARRKGVRLIYDNSIDTEHTSSDLDILNWLTKESYRDIRSLNVRDLLIRMADVVTSIDFAIAARRKHFEEYITIIRNNDPDRWFNLLKSITQSPQRQDKTKGKKILFIAPTLMHPYQHISDMLAMKLMDMGHTVCLFTPKPSRFHTETVCRLENFGKGFIKQVNKHCEDSWKIPLIIDKDCPDLIMTVQAYVLPHQVLREINKRKIKSIIWFTDEHGDTFKNCSIARYFTHVFTCDKSSLMYYRHHGNPNTFYLPLINSPASFSTKDGKEIHPGENQHELLDDSAIETMFRFIEENNNASFNTKCHKTHFIQIDDSGDESFSDTINNAILETPSDFVGINTHNINKRDREIESLLKEFYEDLYLGLLILKDSVDGAIAGLLMPVRVLMDAGSFRFGNAGLSLLDMRYRLLDMGLSVKELFLEGLPSKNSIFSKKGDEEESNRFAEEWTENPEKRLIAHRMLKTVLENAWRISRMDGSNIVLKALDICPGFLKGHEYLGKIFIKEGNANKAKEHLKYIWENNRKDIPAALLYAMSLYITKEDDNAVNVLNHILSSNPNSLEMASAYYQKGLIQQKNGDMEGAAISFISALEHDTGHTNSMKELALIYMQAGKGEEAIRLIKARLSFIVNDETLNDAGVFYWLTGQREEAYEWFARALKDNPSCKSAAFNIATAGTELGRIDEVIEYIQKCITYHPRDKELLNLLKNINKAEMRKAGVSG